MKAYQVLVKKPDNSIFAFGVFQSIQMAQASADTLTNSGYLDDQDKAVLNEVTIHGVVDDVVARKPRKKKTVLGKTMSEVSPVLN